MKFYCDKCKCELKISQEVIDAWEKVDADWNGGKGYDTSYEGYQKWDTKHVLCDICSNESMEVWMDRIPEHETLEHCEKRTGKPYPKEGLVWYRLSPGSFSPCWDVMSYEGIKHKIEAHGWENVQIVIADPPVPPPDDWTPGASDD
jgi:hypothetical protein